MCVSYLCRVENALDVLDQRVIILLQIWVRLDGALQQQLNVPQLGKVKVPLLLQAANRLLLRRQLLLQCAHVGRAGSGGGSWTGCSGGWRHTPSGRARRGRAGPRGTTPGRRSSRALATTHGIIVTAREVLVPEPLGPLEKFQVVLHTAFRKLLDGYRLIYLVFSKDIYHPYSLDGPGPFFQPGSSKPTGPTQHTLENLEVLEVGVFSVDIELDTGHGNVH